MSRTSLDILERAESAAFAAAQHMLGAIRDQRSLVVRRKEDSTIVTALDLESQEIIREGLAGVLPIVAEEDPASHALLSHDECILLDPLDGTTACRRFSQLPCGQVGFGPLIGVCEGGRVQAAVYADIPSRTLYSALRGQGAYAVPFERWSSASNPSQRVLLRLVQDVPAQRSALLFFPGMHGEIEAAQKLKSGLSLESLYRFGGFANDCTRVARGLEQLIVQFSLKAWDCPAALIAAEAGLSVVVDPLGAGIDFASYRVTQQMRVLICQPYLAADALRTLR